MRLIDVRNFGGTDADEDSLLLASFEDHPAYADLLKHEKFCLVGRKGSGKTAIFKKIKTSSSHDKFVFGHTLKDYPWHHHDKQKKIGVPDEQCYVHAWIYLCLMSLSKILLNQDHSQPHNEQSVDCLRTVENFVVDTYGSRDPDVTQIFSPANKLKLSSSAGFDIKIVKASAKVDTVKMEELPSVIHEVNRNLKQAVISSLNPEYSYFVLFDELDLGFTKESNDYSLRLIGLLLAAKELNREAKSLGKKMTIGVFLRNDIYEYLKFEDKNKITENNVSFVYWDHGQGHNTLKALMEKRFKSAMNSDQTIGWDDLFDEDHRMSGKQKKYNYMADRTFLRPRDIIKFCNEVLAAYKNDRRMPDKFLNEHILAAENPYSDYLYRELEDEIFKHLPKFHDYIGILKYLESLQFTRSEFLEAYGKTDEVFQASESIENIMKNLFEFSVIGYYSAGGRAGGSDYIWKYKDERARFDGAASQFRVHSGFKEVLGLKKYIRSE